MNSQIDKTWLKKNFGEIDLNEVIPFRIEKEYPDRDFSIENRQLVHTYWHFNDFGETRKDKIFSIEQYKSFKTPEERFQYVLDILQSSVSELNFFQLRQTIIDYCTNRDVEILKGALLLKNADSDSPDRLTEDDDIQVIPVYGFIRPSRKWKQIVLINRDTKKFVTFFHLSREQHQQFVKQQIIILNKYL
jgi:hypothetical protein